MVTLVSLEACKVGVDLRSSVRVLSVTGEVNVLSLVLRSPVLLVAPGTTPLGHISAACTAPLN